MKALVAALLLACAAPAVAGELHPFQRGAWRSLRQSHQGRPMVAHFWGLTCAPCLAELPAWGELARERPDAGLVIVAADPFPVKPGALSAALAKAGLSDADNWVFDGMSERLRFEVDPDWQGELPFTLLVGADGSVQATLGPADFGRVRSWLDAQERAR